MPMPATKHYKKSRLKRFFYALIMLGILAGSALYYMLQPSGNIEDFQVYQPPAEPTQAQGSGLRVKFFGVSTMLFDDGKDQLLVDGFFSRPSLSQLLFGKIHSDQTALQQIIQQHQLNRLRAILVSHSHYDHALDLGALGQQLPRSMIIGSNSTLNIARGAQLPEQQLHLVLPKQRLKVGNFYVTAFASKHTPATPVNNDLEEPITAPLRQPARFSDFKEGGSFDYLIEHGEQKILVKASTGIVDGQYRHLQVDTLFLGIAQLSRQDDIYQKHYLDETLVQLKPKQVIPIHWDDFFQPRHKPLRFLPRIADHSAQSLQHLIDAAGKQNSQVILLTDPQPFLLTADRSLP